MITLDIETNYSHDIIWCVVTQDVATGEQSTHTDASTLLPVIEQADGVVGHNLIGFDAPVLEKVWGVVIPHSKQRDTLVMSRLWNPSLEGGHSLDSWGKRFGDEKIEFSDYDGGLSEEMIIYCEQDVKLTTRLYKHLLNQLDTEGFTGECVDLEEKVAIITAQQERNGFMLDVEPATLLWQDITHRMRQITAELQIVFPPIVEERWSEKTEKRLKDRVTEFNVGSRKQIAERLQAVGVKFKKTTEKGNIIVDEKVLEGIDIPEAKLIHEYLMLQKRSAQIDSWLSFVKDGRVHGRVITNGAVTGRMTHHSPNMAQCPAVTVPYGKDMRSFWCVPEGYKLVGIDASGLELRMLAHYMRDDNYTKEILNGDIHTANMKAAGLTDRSQSKTFIYAFLYGAGAARIGQVVGGGYKEGQKLIDSFLRNTPALARLRERVAKFALAGTLPSLDGRLLRVRSEHAALNCLLQGAGAVVMKKALVLLASRLSTYDIPYKLVANVHDEFQIEVPENFADVVGKAAVRAIRDAGTELSLRCPLDGKYNVGNNWAETH